MRVPAPLPEEPVSHETGSFSIPPHSIPPHQGGIHFIKAITIQVNVKVIGDIHISMTQEARKDLHINAFVIAVSSECVAKHMLAPVRHTSSSAQALGLV